MYVPLLWACRYLRSTRKYFFIRISKLSFAEMRREHGETSHQNPRIIVETGFLYPEQADCKSFPKNLHHTF